MQFNVPKFIDTEDKVIGPLTIKQFFYLAGGVIVLFILWFFLTFTSFIMVCIPVGTLSVLLAFYKINDQPLINFIGLGITYLSKPRLYLWKKIQKNPKS